MSIKKSIEDYLFKKGYFIITPRTHSFGGFYRSLNLGLRICYFLKKKPIYCAIIFSRINHYKSITNKVFGLKIIIKLILDENKFSIFFSFLLFLVANFCNILYKIKFYRLLELFFGKKLVNNLNFSYFGFGDENFDDFRFISLRDLSNIFINRSIYGSKINKVFEKDNKNKNSICFVVKDKGYKKIVDISLNQVASIENYKKALNFFIEKKYNISRVGEPSMTKFDFKNSNFFDFTKKRKHFDYLNKLCAASAFYFGTGAGQVSVANFYNKRCLITDSVCYSLPPVYLNNDFIIFKKIFCLKQKKILSLDEIFKRVNLATGLHTHNLSEKSESIVLIENTEEEILDTAKDFLNFSDQTNNSENKLLNDYHQMRKDYINKNNFFNDKSNLAFYEFFINSEGSIPENFLKTYLYPNVLLKEVSEKVNFMLKKKQII